MRQEIPASDRARLFMAINMPDVVYADKYVPQVAFSSATSIERCETAGRYRHARIFTNKKKRCQSAKSKRKPSSIIPSGVLDAIIVFLLHGDGPSQYDGVLLFA